MEQTNHGSSIEIQTTHQNTSEHNFTDFISALPDSLLLHNILSRLDMKEVIKTSLLSRRWRYLWKSIPCLYLRQFTFEFPNFIDRCLFHHEGSKIRKFHVRFRYEDGYAPFVDSWIHFATRREVEKFTFVPFCIDDEIYKLPRSLYFCRTLTSLSLYKCNLNLPESFQLGSLVKLSLRMIELHPHSIEQFSSSCPILEDIFLIGCNKESDLNIVITNKSVERLEIRKFGRWESGTIKINAPTLLSLGIYNCCPSVSTVRFHVEELGSLMSADIIGKQGYRNCCEDADFGRNWLGELLYDLRHVKQLKLCGWCLLVLSLMKLKNANLLSISATRLELQASLTKWELPGIGYLLQSCSNLKKLKTATKGHFDEIMLSDEFIDNHDFEEEQFWESLETDETSIMQKINIIKLNDLSGTSHEKFVQFFLTKAKVLKKMVINTPKGHANSFELLRQRLNAFPRSSPMAKLFIT